MKHTHPLSQIALADAPKSVPSLNSYVKCGIFLGAPQSFSEMNNHRAKLTPTTNNQTTVNKSNNSKHAIKIALYRKTEKNATILPHTFAG
jgi:hypothetical protein